MAYYSKLQLDIYHVCKNCHVGNNIETENLREGQPAEARLCNTCNDLRSKGDCTSGTPTPARQIQGDLVTLGIDERANRIIMHLPMRI